jgi:hypothetical protein
VYRRLHPDQPAYTVVAGGGGGSMGCHHVEPGSLSNRVRALHAPPTRSSRTQAHDSCAVARHTGFPIQHRPTRGSSPRRANEP